MKNKDYIREFANGELSMDGYNYFVSLIKFYIKKYNWPKLILDERIDEDISWKDEDILSFSQQLLIFVLEKGKLKNSHKIPGNYIEYYFKTVIISYVANKIKDHQNKLGLSFDDTKRISIEILNDDYFKEIIDGNFVWNREKVFADPILKAEEVSEVVVNLQKIPITEKTKQYKPLVKRVLIDVFELINRPIEEKVIFNIIFKLFDQTSFASVEDEKENKEIRKEIVEEAIEKVVKQINQTDIPMFLDYFFSDNHNSLAFISEKYNMPKSTVQFKTSQFTKVITESLIPENEQEGVFYLENIHKKLDELR